jgi:hypothetical protein
MIHRFEPQGGCIRAVVSPSMPIWECCNANLYFAASLIASPTRLRQARRADMSRSAFVGLIAAWTIMLGAVLAISVYIRMTI